MQKLALFPILFIILCCKTESIDIEKKKFDWSGNTFGTSSFLVKQHSKDSKAELYISGDALKLNLTKEIKVYDISNFDLKILEYKNKLEKPEEELSLDMMGKGRDKTNTLLNTWTPISGSLEIQLIEGKTTANSCTSSYTINLQLKNVEFYSSFTKANYSLKSLTLNNLHLGWCLE
ncbi:MAG: hypothetical protein ACRCVT_04870 [Leadbetterella sp.]